MSIKNEGTTDRVLRIALGLTMLTLGLTDVVGGTAGFVITVVGLVPLLTGLIGWCPLYALFGVSTCPADRTGRRDRTRVSA